MSQSKEAKRTVTQMLLNSGSISGTWNGFVICKNGVIYAKRDRKKKNA